MQFILLGKQDTLHYFILWLRNGHRTANFIKLSESPSNQIFDEWYQIQSNLLEALFCKAFLLTTVLLNQLCLVLMAPTRSIKFKSKPYDSFDPRQNAANHVEAQRQRINNRFARSTNSSLGIHSSNPKRVSTASCSSTVAVSDRFFSTSSARRSQMTTFTSPSLKICWKALILAQRANLVTSLRVLTLAVYHLRALFRPRLGLTCTMS
ncbi:hypothetical protein CI102_13462 [Trichoderma harzianum]|uniref:Uncharacterized protein n=1 Tax=Trichoderma harzianum CBS 226.95 TaxID=983964 RepID=A0A2T4AEC8_TRIHA|nr:hypothetical protein M431DRAFT_397195 [Trichoderma harzianum CBS 226.95]PKK42950.1 hypothetical protein CI102_13462 [Trichoderma harzianum]PTB55278.1 hypothetical protein M431DRAFT_397195 [Trichoderma harzianum CBS 226.95]